MLIFACSLLCPFLKCVFLSVCRDDLDIVFVIDGSWSVGETLFEKEKHFLATTLKNLGDAVVKKTRVGVIQFGTNPHSEFSLHTFSTAMDIDQRLQSVPLRGGGRYLGRAINFALTEYLPPPSDRTTVLVVLLTGNSQDNIHPIMQSILQSTLHLVVVGVKNAPIPLLNMHLFDKRFFASDFDNQQGLMQDLVNALCQLQDRVFDLDVRANLFQSTYVFVQHPSRFCAVTFGTRFLFHLVNIALSLGVGGVVDVETQFQLDTYSQKQLVRKAIKKLKLEPGALHAGKVLRYVRQNQFVKSAGSRIADGVPQVAIIVLPEKSHDAVSAAASELRHHGVSVFAFGTEHSDQQQLKNIVNEKLSSHISFIDQDPVESILMQLCRGVFNEIHSIPQATTKGNYAPQTPFLIKGLERTQRTVIERCFDTFDSCCLLIVMDGSKSVSKMNFNHMRNFVYSMLYGMDLSMETTRVGLVQIGNVPRAEFSLRDFTKKQSLLDTIMTLSPRGGARMTGHTLDFVLRDMLSDSTADRTKTVIVLVTGKSADSVQVQADKLSREGVNAFTIGLKDEIDDDLALMASAQQKSHLIALTCFKQLSRIPDEVISIMARPTLKSSYPSPDFSGLDMETSEGKSVYCYLKHVNKSKSFRLSQTSCRASIADILIVMDGSSSIIGANFEILKKFFCQFVGNFEIGPQYMQIGMMQYSTDPHTEFLFNECPKKEDVVKAIQNIKQVIGDTYTAEALRYAVKHFYIESTGNRLTAGVPQMAIVFTDGEAHDKYEVEASVKELKDLGVKVLCIGVQNALIEELELIASSPELVYYVDDFSDLENIETYVSDMVCDQPKGSWPETPSVNMDMVFIVDGSTRLRQDQFQKVKAFLKTAFGLFPIAKTPERPDGAQIGVMLHGPLRPEFNLTTYTGKGPMRKHVQRMQQIVGGVGLAGQTIKWTMQHVFPSPINRLDAKRVMVVLTNAMDGDPVSLRSAALQAKCQGFVVVMLGVGGSLDGTLASRPKHLHSLQLEDYSELTKGHVAGFFHQLVQNWKGEDLGHHLDIVKVHSLGSS
uniref:VWFA domain-containing protein n=1 Tax=Eptatretus burgeri TaxID=7764 RepID=A0A8C4QAG4_EPTBU